MVVGDAPEALWRSSNTCRSMRAPCTENRPCVARGKRKDNSRAFLSTRTHTHPHTHTQQRKAQPVVERPKQIEFGAPVIQCTVLVAPDKPFSSI